LSWHECGVGVRSFEWVVGSKFWKQGFNLAKVCLQFKSFSKTKVLVPYKTKWFSKKIMNFEL